MENVKIVGDGRMGKMVAKVIDQRNELKLGKAKYDIIKKEGCQISFPSKWDVAIVFVPSCAGYEVTKGLLDDGVRSIVVGTTGFYLNPDGSENEKMLQEFEKLAIKNNCRLLLSPNFAIGVNIFYEVVKVAAKMLSKYDSAVIETHHIGKADRPSGTALKLAKILMEASGGRKNSLNFGHGKRKDNEIGLSSVRVGGVPGEHNIRFCSPNGVDEIELIHRVKDPRIFAEGAINAALWIEFQGPGSYTMKDML